MLFYFFSFTDPKFITFLNYQQIKAQSDLSLNTVTTKSWPLAGCRKPEICVVVQLVRRAGPDTSGPPSVGEDV